MKRALIYIVVLIMFLCTAPVAPISFAGTVDKDTTWFDPDDKQNNYKISTEAQLLGLASLVNEEQTDNWKNTRLEHFEGVTFTLTRDIELTQTWTPIGLDDSVNFCGIFDGNGHTISGLNVRGSYDGSGLFGYLSGEVRNLNVVGNNKSLTSSCGGIAGTLSDTGKIIDCTSDVKVKGLDKCGGIVGNNEGGTVEGCINLGNVSGTYKVGGIVGENRGGTINECGNQGKIKSTRRGVATYGTGGVSGRSISENAKITSCYNTGEIHSNTEATGGVVGYMSTKGSTLKDSYNTGTINIDIKTSDKKMSPAYVGGVVGIAGVVGIEIRNCYSTGMINNPDISGGIIGRYRNITEVKDPHRYIKNNYYISKALSSGFGLIDNPKDDYIDKAAKGVSEANMHNLASSLSAAYMKGSGAFSNYGYPVLRWQKPIVTTSKEFFKDIPSEKQKLFDKYLISTAGNKAYGQVLMDVLAPQNSTSNGFMVYMDAQERFDEFK